MYIPQSRVNFVEQFSHCHHTRVYSWMKYWVSRRSTLGWLYPVNAFWALWAALRFWIQSRRTVALKKKPDPQPPGMSICVEYTDLMAERGPAIASTTFFSVQGPFTSGGTGTWPTGGVCNTIDLAFFTLHFLNFSSKWYTVHFI